MFHREGDFFVHLKLKFSYASFADVFIFDHVCKVYGSMLNLL